MTPRDVHLLIPGIREYARFTWQKGVCRYEKNKVLRWESIMDYLREPNVIERVFMREKKGRELRVRGDMREEADIEDEMAG